MYSIQHDRTDNFIISLIQISNTLMFIYLPNIFRLRFPVLLLVALRTSLTVSLLQLICICSDHSFELLSEEVTRIYIYIIHRSSFKSPALFDHGTSGRKSLQESNGVNNTNGGPTQVPVLICS